MTVRLVALVFDALHPDRLAQFWAHALGWEARAVGDDDVQLVPTDETSFPIRFRRVAHEKAGQNRIHFDLTTADADDQARTVTELLSRGGRHVDIGQDPADTHVVLADPEKNELCVLGPGNRFLAGCPRLGAVNCDGTHALGVFWSRATGWPLVWDEGEETAIQAPDGTGPKITWSGPPMMPRVGAERLHFHVAPAAGATVPAAIDLMLGLGATRLETVRGCTGAVALADVDGNPFCVVDG